MRAEGSGEGISRGSARLPISMRPVCLPASLSALGLGPLCHRWPSLERELPCRRPWPSPPGHQKPVHSFFFLLQRKAGTYPSPAVRTATDGSPCPAVTTLGTDGSQDSASWGHLKPQASGQWRCCATADLTNLQTARAWLVAGTTPTGHVCLHISLCSAT